MHWSREKGPDQSGESLAFNQVNKGEEMKAAPIPLLVREMEF